MLFEKVENPQVKAMCLLLQSLEENLYNPFALADVTENKIIYASATLLNVYKESFDSISNEKLKNEVERSILPIYAERYASVNELLENLREKGSKVIRFGFEVGTRSISEHEIVYIISSTKVEVPESDGHVFVLFSLSLASNNPNRRIAVCIESESGERHYYMKLVKGGEWKKYDKQRLTPTECHILQMSGYGLTIDEIAEAMCCSANTIKTHRAHIMEKLAAKGMVEAMVSAMNSKAFFNGK